MRRGRVGAVAVAAAALMALPGCELKDDGDNLVNGKTQFVAKCGSCHTLSRANATGVVGPNLDEAWQQADKDGLGPLHLRGRRAPADPAAGPQRAGRSRHGPPGRRDARQPRHGRGRGGRRRLRRPGGRAAAARIPGRLATVGPERSEEVARAEGGTLSIPADPSGATLYTAGAAVAPPGALTVESENPSGVPHNIAVEGNGVNEEGPVVQNGGVSRVEVDLDAGEYTFYCSVPGHREGGMEGPLRVE